MVFVEILEFCEAQKWLLPVTELELEDTPKLFFLKTIKLDTRSWKPQSKAFTSASLIIAKWGQPKRSRAESNKFGALRNCRRGRSVCRCRPRMGKGKLLHRDQSARMTGLPTLHGVGGQGTHRKFLGYYLTISFLLGKKLSSKHVRTRRNRVKDMPTLLSQDSTWHNR